MVAELKNRNKEMNKDKHRLLKQDEVYHGALEDILLGLCCQLFLKCSVLFPSQSTLHEWMLSARVNTVHTCEY